MRIAAVSWQVRAVGSIAEFEGHMEGLVRSATATGADLVVLPESIDLELCSLEPGLSGAEVPEYLADTFDQRLKLVRDLAGLHGITLVGGTHLRKLGQDLFNTAVIAGPEGLVLQDKNVLTRWEDEDWKLTPGSGLWKLGSVGTTVCYDSEFPASLRALAESGCSVVAVPAFTEHQRGFNRVRWSCHARSVECQVCVVHASLVGGLGGEPVPSTWGSSAILVPSVLPFPESGILAESSFGEEDMAVADLDLAQIDIARTSDDVRNWADRDKGDWTVRSPGSD